MIHGYETLGIPQFQGFLFFEKENHIDILVLKFPFLNGF